MLHVIRSNPARERIDLFDDACATHSSPDVWSGVRPALILGRSPYRFGRRFRSETPGAIEWNSEVVAQRRLTGILVVSDGPLTREINLGKRGGNADQHHHEKKTQIDGFHNAS
jgi:hypothetical protein